MLLTQGLDVVDINQDNPALSEGVRKFARFDIVPHSIRMAIEHLGGFTDCEKIFHNLLPINLFYSYKYTCFFLTSQPSFYTNLLTCDKMAIVFL